MKRDRLDRSAAAGGFTLVELIIVIVTLAIASVGIISLNANIFSGQDNNRTLEAAAPLMQECAERILAERRNGGYGAAALATSALAEGLCTGMTVTLAIGGAGTIPACPYPDVTSTLNCKLITIRQGALTPITLMLVNY